MECRLKNWFFLLRQKLFNKEKVEISCTIKKDIIKNPENCRSHVVLLGAGASRAAFGETLPLMNDLVDKLDLKSLLENAGIESSGNFETIYSNLEDKALKKIVEDRIFNYFYSLSLPSTATIYDRLLLSLRRKDAIFTFNWDPFLFDAYQRNYLIAPLPQIYFLHGNVRIGACKICDQWGRKFALCPTCNKNFTHVPLFYPVKKKDYFTDNQYTANSWKCAEDLFSDAFTITIFGYSAPESDLEAMNLLKKAWLQKSSRAFEHVELIDILNQNDLYDRWKDFAPTGHLSSVSTFEDSRLNLFPRRSCEALFYAMSEGFPCKRFPLEKTDDLTKLQNEIKKIAQYEDAV